VHTLFLVLTQFAECVKNDWRTCSPYSPPATIFLLLFLTFEGLMFGIFTIIMLATQLTAILNDQTVGAWLDLSTALSANFLPSLPLPVCPSAAAASRQTILSNPRERCPGAEGTYRHGGIASCVSGISKTKIGPLFTWRRQIFNNANDLQHCV